MSSLSLIVSNAQQGVFTHSRASIVVAKCDAKNALPQIHYGGERTEIFDLENPLPV